jgi:hypothetical protein
MHVELVVPPTTKPNSKPNSKLFPVLVFLLMACYGIMALVVLEQGHVIQSQRNLIQQLVQDSQQLASLKGQVAAQQAIDKKRAKSGASAKDKTGASSAVPAQKEQAQKGLSRKSRAEKQPLQADDKVDRRRFPSQI